MKRLGVPKLYEVDEVDRKKMRDLAILLTKIAKRLIAEDPGILDEIKADREKAG